MRTQKLPGLQKQAERWPFRCSFCITTWFTVPPKRMVRLEPFFKWWTTAWITVLPRRPLVGEVDDIRWATAWLMVPPKLLPHQGWGRHRWTTAWFMAHPKLAPHNAHLIRRWTTTWITVPPKPRSAGKSIERGELLLGLPYLRNRAVVLCPLN